MNSKAQISFFFLVLIHVFGFIGIGVPLHDQFILLTPFNLLLSLAIVGINHEGEKRPFFEFLGMAAMIGFLAELIGVQTGMIFGRYTYGSVLGPKILETPLFIGVNWALVAYSAGMISEKMIRRSDLMFRVVSHAVLMVLLDFVMEPVAVLTKMWTWEGGVIPLQNYIGWFVVSLLVAWLYQRKLSGTENAIARTYYTILVLFFICLGFVLS